MHLVKGRLIDADLPTRAGVADLKIRWTRNRYTSREERPCLGIAFVSDEPADDGAINQNGDELTRVLALDLVLDMQIETEASSELNEAIATPIDDFDVTGLDALSAVLDIALLCLRECLLDPLCSTTPLGRAVDWIRDEGIDDDEDLQDDDGRLVARVNVLYRTSSWDPTLLLERE